MHEAIGRMLAGYGTKNTSDSIRALREILQEVALLGLWRAKFFLNQSKKALDVKTTLVGIRCA